MRLVDDIDHHGQIIDCLLRRRSVSRLSGTGSLPRPTDCEQRQR